MESRFEACAASLLGLFLSFRWHYILQLLLFTTKSAIFSAIWDCDPAECRSQKSQYVKNPIYFGHKSGYSGCAYIAIGCCSGHPGINAVDIGHKSSHLGCTYIATGRKCGQLGSQTCDLGR